MPVLQIITQNDKIVNDFIDELNEKLETKSFFQNPFRGFIDKEIKNNKLKLLVNLEVAWFNPLYPAITLTITMFMFNKIIHPSLFVLPALLWFGYFLFTRTFLRLVFKQTLRKKGYNDIIQFTPTNDLIIYQRNKIKELESKLNM